MHNKIASSDQILVRSNSNHSRTSSQSSDSDRFIEAPSTSAMQPGKPKWTNTNSQKAVKSWNNQVVHGASEEQVPLSKSIQAQQKQQQSNLQSWQKEIDAKLEPSASLAASASSSQSSNKKSLLSTAIEMARAELKNAVMLGEPVADKIKYIASKLESAEQLEYSRVIREEIEKNNDLFLHYGSLADELRK